MPTHPVYRAARAMVFATVCVGLAITGHTMASGATVPPAAALGGLGLTAVTGIVLAGTERSLATILGSLLAGQFVLHALFTAAQHGQHLGHGADDVVPCAGGWTMTLAHALAAVVSAWWLHRGEHAVWNLARRVAAAVTRPVRALLSVPPSPATVRHVRTGPVSRSRPRPALLRHVVVRRGPPSPRASLA